VAEGVFSRCDLVQIGTPAQARMATLAREPGTCHHPDWNIPTPVAPATAGRSKGTTKSIPCRFGTKYARSWVTGAVPAVAKTADRPDFSFIHIPEHSAMNTIRKARQGGGRTGNLLALALFAAGLGTSIAVQAAGDSYLEDTGGKPVMSGDQTCVHGMDWNRSMPPCPEPTVVVDEETVKVVFALDDSEFFGSDRATLNASSQKDLSRLVKTLKSADDVHAILVTGHADRIGPAPYNEQLALKRANNVKTYLVDRGIPGDKIVAAGEGLRKPWVSCPENLAKSELIKCLAPNRRVDIEAVFNDDITLTDVTVIPPAE
jgi:outer membrane protein OmpA-like peptidoglycan-associated protein